MVFSKILGFLIFIKKIEPFINGLVENTFTELSKLLLKILLLILEKLKHLKFFFKAPELSEFLFIILQTNKKLLDCKLIFSLEILWFFELIII